MEETKEERFIYLRDFFLIFLDRRNQKLKQKEFEKNIFLQLK